MVTRKEYFDLNEEVPPGYQHYPEYREIFEEYVPVPRPSAEEIFLYLLFITASILMMISFIFGGFWT